MSATDNPDLVGAQGFGEGFERNEAGEPGMTEASDLVNSEVEMEDVNKAAEQGEDSDEGILDNNLLDEEEDMSECEDDEDDDDNIAPKEGGKEVVKVVTEVISSAEAIHRLMGDSTMKSLHASKAPDMVCIVACPVHDFNVGEGSGFFLIDMADLARKTMGDLMNWVDNCSAEVGCYGHDDCEENMQEAIENGNLPDEVYCLVSGEPHTAPTDAPCERHPETSGLHQVANCLAKLIRMYRKKASQAVNRKADLPGMTITVLGNKPVLPVMLDIALGLSMALASPGEETDLEDFYGSLPGYLKVVKNLVFDPAKARSDLPLANRKGSLASTVVKSAMYKRLCEDTKEARKTSYSMERGLKRTMREQNVSVPAFKKLKTDTGVIGNPKLINKADIQPTAMQGVLTGWSDVIQLCPIQVTKVSMNFGRVTSTSMDSMGVSKTTTRTLTYNRELKCLTCSGDRYRHDILDNKGDHGLIVLLGDQFLPAIVSSQPECCVVVCRYSNLSLGDLYEFLLQPLVKDKLNSVSGDTNGVTYLLQEALKAGLEVKLAVSSGTSLLMDGAANYIELMQMIYDLSQSWVFKMSSEVGARSRIVSCTFPQPCLPYIELADHENKRLLRAQHDTEATMLARMHVGSTCHKNVRCHQSETDLVGMESFDRSAADELFDVVTYGYKSTIRNSGNPSFDRLPCSMRLSEVQNWVSRWRSDERQKLSIKFLIEWSEAFCKDLDKDDQHSYPTQQTRAQLLSARADLPNILIDSNNWDKELESVRAEVGGSIAYCHNPSKHIRVEKATVVEMRAHREVCRPVVVAEAPEIIEVIEVTQNN